MLLLIKMGKVKKTKENKLRENRKKLYV